MINPTEKVLVTKEVYEALLDMSNFTVAAPELQEKWKAFREVLVSSGLKSTPTEENKFMLSRAVSAAVESIIQVGFGQVLNVTVNVHTLSGGVYQVNLTNASVIKPVNNQATLTPLKDKQ